MEKGLNVLTLTHDWYIGMTGSRFPYLWVRTMVSAPGSCPTWERPSGTIERNTYRGEGD